MYKCLDTGKLNESETDDDINMHKAFSKTPGREGLRSGVLSLNRSQTLKASSNVYFFKGHRKIASCNSSN